MSEVTAVPLRPITKGSLAKLWIGIGALLAVGIGVAWAGTAKQVAMSESPTAFLAHNAKKPGVQTTPSGLQFKILQEGSGPTATSADTVVVDYEGKLADGSTFDASARHGGPATLPVAGLIPGWTEGLKRMNAGSKVRFWIPPELGYGPAGAGDGVIPPNALLIFDVKLHAIAPQQLGGVGGYPGGAGEGQPEAR